MRVCLIAAVAAAIVVLLIAGPSVAHVIGQTGYGGAPQDLGEQVINPKKASSSNATFWVGLLLAAAVLAGTGFIGWRRAHNHSEY